MKESQAFSVLLSVYAKEKADHLEAALTSILVEQSLMPNQVVLVKDGDLTPELERVIVHFQERFTHLDVLAIEGGRGLDVALNAGLSHCRYEWVARMDTDDIASPSRFEEQMAYLQKHPELAVLGGAIAEFSENEQKIETIKRLPLGHRDLLEYSKFRNPLNHMTVFFQKAAVLSVGGYLPAPYMEDYYLWVRLLAKGYRMANLDSILVKARTGPGMYQRRGKVSQLKGRWLINQVLIENNSLSHWKSLGSFLALGVMILLPNGIRKWIYQYVLRKKSS